MAISFPLFNRTVRISENQRRPGFQINYRGLKIYFAGDRNSLYYRPLIEGKIKFVGLPDRLELHLIDQGGVTQILGRVNLGPAGMLMIGNKPIEDKTGPIKCGMGRRYISADLLFPEFGKVRITNRFFKHDSHAVVIFRNMKMVLPVDRDNLWGEAAREERIFIIANYEKIDFYQMTREGKGIHIGAINIDNEGYLLKNGIRYVKDGLRINVYDKRKNEIKFAAADLLESLNIKDLPVYVMRNRRRAEAIYHQVTFVFSIDPRGKYNQDIQKKAICLRVGYSDRIEVIRKEQGGEEILGTIKIDNEGYLLDAAGIRYTSSKGPIRFWEKRLVWVSRLVQAFRPNPTTPDIQEKKDLSQALVRKYLYLVGVFARKYVGQGASEDELEDAGWEGLRKASRKYDEKRGYTFRTYARRWIMSEMQATIRRKKKEIWGGEDRARLIGTLRREERRFHQRMGYDPSDQELAVSLALTEKRVHSLRQSAARRVYSLEAPKNGNGELLWIDCLPDVSVVDPEREAIAREAHAKIEAALGTLDPRASFILRTHFGLGSDDELSLEKIGEILGEAERGEPLTREGIRQLKDRALSRVRENYPALASYL